MRTDSWSAGYWFFFGLVIGLVSVANSVEGETRKRIVEVEYHKILLSLESPRTRDRYRAVMALGSHSIATAKDLPRLIEAIEDPEVPVRVGAARSLSLLGYRRVDAALLGALLRGLEDPSENVQLAATLAVSRIAIRHPELLPHLESGLSSSSTYQQLVSASVLHQLFPQRANSLFRPGEKAEMAVDLLWELVDSEDPWDRQQYWVESRRQKVSRMAQAAASMDARVANSMVPDLVQRFQGGSSDALFIARALAPYLDRYRLSRQAALASKDPEVRKRAALAVGLLKQTDPQSFSLLMSLLRPDEEAVHEGIRALSLWGEPAKPAVRALERLITTSTDLELRKEAGRALIRIDLEAVHSITERLELTDPEFAKWLFISVLKEKAA